MGNNGALAGWLPGDVIEMRLPTRPEYVSVLRATAGIIAGEMSFSYDEVLNIRVAVSEAFMMAMSCVGPGEGIEEITVRFSIGATGLEVLIPAPRTYFHDPRSQGEMERRMLLGSLVDKLELGSGATGEPMVRMLKHRSRAGT